MRRDVVRLVRQSVALTLALVLASCTNDSPTQPMLTASYVTPTGLVTANPPQIFIGAGDISSCGNSGDEATAQIIDTIPGTVYLLGDNVYDTGNITTFNNCYNPNWGRFKNRTKPSAGNHEYNDNGAAGYFAYFGAAAGDPSKGYYSYDLGLWHIIVLNSNISRTAGSAQDTWLASDLAAHPNQCTLSYWHHPLYSSGGSGSAGQSNSSMRPFWDRLYAAHADLVLNGHRHFYDRMQLMKPDGSADPANGIRTIIAGMGGIGGGSVSSVFPTSQVRNGDTRGVIKLYLYDDSYAWKFLPVAGKTFTDSGSTACHVSGGGGGGISASNSTVGAAPSSFIAGSGSSTITVTVKDGSNNVVSGANVVFAATGSGNTFTPSNATTDGSGVATGTFTSTVAQSKTVTATANGVGITQQATVTVNPGTVSAAQSTVTAAPASFVVGSGSSTVTVTAKDANGNGISGASVAFASTGSGNTLTPPSGNTNASGAATSTLTSTVAELKTVSATINGTPITQTAPVNVTPPGAGGTITQTLLTSGSGGNPTNQSVYTTASISPAPNALITVAVLSHRSTAAITPTLSGGGMSTWTAVGSVSFDLISTPRRRVTVFRAMSAAPGSGPITITFANTVSNAQWVVSQWTGIDQSGTNGSGAIGQVDSARGDAVSSLSVPLAAFANANNVGFGAMATNANPPFVTPGSGMTEIVEASANESNVLEAEWGTNQNTIQASLTSAKTAGLLGIEIKASGSGGPVVSASQSMVSAVSPITAGGSSTITVTVNDGSGNPISGVNVTLSATGSNTITQPAALTDVSGVTTGSLSATVAGSNQVTAVAGGVTLNQKPTVVVDPAPPTSLGYTTQPSNTAANAPISPAVVVEIRDAFNNRVNSGAIVNVDFGNNAGSGTLTGTLARTAVNGVATFSDLAITDIANGYTLKASSTALTDAISNSFNITPPVPSASLSTVVAGTPSFTAGGNSDITVTVKDGLGNAMSGVTVTLSSTVGGDVVTQPATTTDGSGIATGNVAATSAGQRTITAVAGGITITQKPVLTVNAATANAGTSTVSANPTTITAGSGSSTITVTVRDQYGNALGGSSVVLGATGTGNSFGQPGLTGSNGVTTGTISSTDPQTENVTATADGVLITQQPALTVSNQPPPSSITHTLLTAGNDPANVGVYNTASISPAANALVTIAVVGHRSSAAAASPTVTGGGMSSWVEVATVTFSTVATPLKRMSIFRAMSASPGSGPITITFPATESNASWIVSQWTGVSTTGTNGSGAIAQALTNQADGVTSIGATLAALGSPNNVAYGVVGTSGTAIGINPGAGFTEISEQKPNESPNGILEALFAANQTTPSASWTGAFSAAILAIEIKAGP